MLSSSLSHFHCQQTGVHDVKMASQGISYLSTCFKNSCLPAISGIVVDEGTLLSYTYNRRRKELFAMAIERTAHPYIIRDSSIYEGEPIIEGTKTGVRHVILLFQSGKDPEEIASIHRLSLAQVYDALSFYYDNDTEIEHNIRNES
jgi:uncharacterized protein (DUF433 family)